MLLNHPDLQVAYLVTSFQERNKKSVHIKPGSIMALSALFALVYDRQIMILPAG